MGRHVECAVLHWGALIVLGVPLQLRRMEKVMLGGLER